MFSLNKLLLLIAVIGVVWYVAKVWGRIQREREAAEQLAEKRQLRSADLVKCRKCGVFVEARRCQRSDCPQPVASAA